jgi:hypothetical protein
MLLTARILVATVGALFALYGLTVLVLSALAAVTRRRAGDR